LQFPCGAKIGQSRKAGKVKAREKGYNNVKYFPGFPSFPVPGYLASMGQDILINWEKKSGERQKEYKKFLHRANKNKVLKQLPELNEEAFEKIDCLQCANCCKNYSPRFTPPDIKRISKYIGMKEGDFKDKYLVTDEEGDNVLKEMPCAFLGNDNACSIYDVRPADCARFPYMDDDFMLKRQPMALKNSTFCPITYYVIEKLIAAEKAK